MHLLLYGGTFDPVHHGHLITCRRAREILRADQVVFMPAGLSPHKTAAAGGAKAEDRLAMLRLAVAGDGGAGFEIDARELERPGPSYTVDTLEAISRERAEVRLTLLLGADQLAKFHLWNRVERLTELVDIAVMPRAGVELATALGLAREKLPAARMEEVGTPLVQISATDIRARVKSGMTISYLVPAAVEAYIKERGLYR